MLLKCPAVLCSQTFLRWKQWNYGFTFSPKCFRLIFTSSFDYRSLIKGFALCLTAFDGHSTPLYCHHWGKALDETAHILWLRSDRRRCVVGIPLVCKMGEFSSLCSAKYMILHFRGREAGWEPLWESQRRCRNSKALLFWKLEDQCSSGQAECLHFSQVAPWP